MNITDLRDELHSRADGLTADPSAIRAGVGDRITSTKRRRAAGALGGLGAAALVAGLLLSNQPGRSVTPAPAVSSPSVTIGADGLPTRAVPDRPGDVVKAGLRYRAQVADDRLAAGFIGDEGQGQFTILWEPQTTHVSFSGECYLPGVDPETAKRITLRLSLVGSTGFFGSQCGSQLPADRDLPPGGVVPGEPGQGWSELTVGRSAGLRVQLVDTRTGKPTSFDTARITAAVYELGEQHSIKDGSGHVVGVLPQVVEHQGYRYLLERVASVPLGGRSLPTLKAPASGPYVVIFGTVGTGAPGADPGFFQLDGLPGDTSLVQEGGLTTAPQAAGSGQALRLHLGEGTPPKAGYGVIALYAPAG
jgi:hypothetical protein